MVRPSASIPTPKLPPTTWLPGAHQHPPPDATARSAHAEVSAAAARLEAAGVRVHLFDDDGAQDTPGQRVPEQLVPPPRRGHVALYPMFAPNRRRERRSDIVEMSQTRYRVQDVIDYSGLEHDNMFSKARVPWCWTTSPASPTAQVEPRRRPVALERFARISTMNPWLSPPQTRKACPATTPT